jgi:hypothetical protein
VLAEKEAPAEANSQEHKVGVTWSPACEDVNLDAEEPQPLETDTEKCDWGRLCLFDSEV